MCVHAQYYPGFEPCPDVYMEHYLVIDFPIYIVLTISRVLIIFIMLPWSGSGSKSTTGTVILKQDFTVISVLSTAQLAFTAFPPRALQSRHIYETEYLKIWVSKSKTFSMSVFYWR